MKKEYLYIYLEQDEHNGDRYDPGDGTRYSGFHHTIKTIRKLGPARFASSSPKSWNYEDVSTEDIDSVVLDEQPEHIYVVYADTYSGGTFGGTDGYIQFLWITDSISKAEKWVKENRTDIEKRYKGWGSALNSIDIEMIHLEK